MERLQLSGSFYLNNCQSAKSDYIKRRRFLYCQIWYFNSIKALGKVTTIWAIKFILHFS